MCVRMYVCINIYIYIYQVYIYLYTQKGFLSRFMALYMCYYYYYYLSSLFIGKLWRYKIERLI